MQRRHHQVGSINQRLIKLKPGQKTAFPVPLVGTYCRLSAHIAASAHIPPDGFSVPLQKASTHLFLTPLFPSVFYPPTFCLPPCPNPVHLFALTYIATFTGFASPRSFICCSFLYESNFINVCFYRRVFHLWIG